ncbi:helix-turn-helix domain-containing protein [Nocardioides sp. cx-173]|uniref:helix-turn-helix domain-containing protein n=1 Tax=Nocardioides sp. cx-173 TaxID=2898796 RepID=UPI001E5350D1|nr:helix-turn-helix transcriptional regulator [Nocardioides sp. cx-173]MCD4525250.1 helix-turn-helix domain-containing protein [Nocardioides sp. cx-173]UGB40947.1 helix-turn-helix domain-containing protein [Nocardioides sp. cx-173]
MNGQEELRANLRAAIKEAGLTQSGAAAAAGVTYTHLTGGLKGDNWLKREAVEALAKVLGTGSADLMGGSIFKEQRDRYAAFDRAPDSVLAWRQEQEAAQTQRLADLAEGRTRALCCECGALRTCTTRGLYPTPENSSPGPHGRFIRTLHCSSCDAQTVHAILRADEDRDCAEKWDAAPTASDLGRKELDELIQRVTSFGVDIHLRPRGKKQRAQEYACLYEYDESKSQWRIEVDPNIPVRAQIELLDYAWRSIAMNDFGDVQWNPKQDGTVLKPSDSGWAQATDDLMSDLSRFLTLERRRLVQHVQDQVAAANSDRDAQE